MRRAIRAYAAIAALVLGSSLAEAALVSGPAAGTTPMLTVNPVGDQGAAYCVTCQAEANPAVVVFAGKNDEATQKLLVELAKQVDAHREQHLMATIVVLGATKQDDGLVAFVREQKIGLPLVTAAPDSTELKAWKINAKAATTAVFFAEHKVHHTAANLPATTLAKQVDALLNASHSSDQGDADHQHGTQDHGMGGCHM